ncbi:MAG TPA: porin [Gemmatimonadetes bacterium]|nr:porin [Gemmatimonadota bacterium]|tara:strand:+ start:725 stop:1375 length:651 start_codon:yes stop_codon:yes gene_type:complete
MTRKLAVEAIGTFFLVFTIGQVVLEPGTSGLLGPLAIGTVLMTMVYAGGHVSGAHYNPAVTLAVFLRGKATVHEMLGYWVFQLVAGALAATVVFWLKGGGPLTVPSIVVAKVLAAEFIFTFALVFVVLNVATVRSVEGNSYFGLAIGATVMAGAYAVGPVSGGVFNPAVTIGAVVLGTMDIANVWVYLVAQLLAGAAGATVFNLLDLGTEKATTEA